MVIREKAPMSFDSPIHTNEASISRVLAAGLPVVLVFWRRDCAPCDALMPALDRLAKSYAGRALIVKVNAQEEGGLVVRYGVDRLPGIVFIAGGRTIASTAGAVAEQELAAWIDHMAGGSGRPPLPAGPSIPLRGADAPAAAGPRTGGNAPGTAAAGAGAGASAGQPVLLTDASFEGVVLQSKLPVLVDFWAPWCGPCKMVAPVVADLAREYAGRAVVAKLDVDDYPRTASRYGVMSIPMLLIFRDGKVVDQIVGAQSAAVLRQRLARQVR
jgi:thioredoxin 1